MISKHDHAGNMLWDDDWCGCKICNQQWRLDLKKGWIPIDQDGNPQREKPSYGNYKPTYAKKKVKLARR